MIKVTGPYYWSALCAIEPVSLVKFASSGLKDKDRTKLAKRAGEAFSFQVSQLPPPNGEEYVHVVALGSLEAYGPNRKGDAFPEDVCRKYHKTFEKHARWYREHRHHDPAKSYGVVKYSAYNEKMRRIDLIVALNATKTAAERNGGLVADEELDLLFRGESLPVSMACRVSYDICSGCGNKARTTWQYCTQQTCTKYGGCAGNLGKAFDDGHILHVINPDPLFFDISYVSVPADRIAYTLGLLKRSLWNKEKLAEDLPIESYYQQPLYNGTTAPSWLLTQYGGPLSQKKLQKLDILVVLEKESSIDRDQRWRAFSDPYFADHLEISDPFSAISYLADKDCLIPPQQFVYWFHQRLGMAPKQGSWDLSHAFRTLRSAADLDARLAENHYLFDSVKTASDQRVLEKVIPAWSLAPEHVYRRVSEKMIWQNGRLPFTKKADYNHALLKEYATYQLEMATMLNYNEEKLKLLVLANKSWNC